MADRPFIDLNDITLKAIRKVFERRLNRGDIDAETYLKETEHLWTGLQSGMGHHGSIAFTDTRLDTIQAMRRNIFTFAAFKRHHHIADMVNALTDENGQLRSWSKFKNEALKISKDYNENWLRAEYNTTVRGGQTAAQWHDFQKNKDLFPYLQYKTQDDSLVRRSHQLLHNITKHIDDPFWDQYYPPNGWQCRCYVLKQENGDTSNPVAFPDDKEVPPMFKFNGAKEGVVFSRDHPYLSTVAVREKINILNNMRTILVDEEIYDLYGNSIKVQIPGIVTHLFRFKVTH